MYPQALCFISWAGWEISLWLFSPRIGIKGSVWRWDSAASWFNTLQIFGTECTLKWKVAFFFCWPCWMAHTCFWEIRETSDSLLAGAERDTRRAGDGICSTFSLFMVSWLSQGWTVAGFFFYLCRHVFSIRQDCVTPDIGQVTWVTPCTAHKQKGKDLQLHPDTLATDIFVKPGVAGSAHMSETIYTCMFWLLPVVYHNFPKAAVGQMVQYGLMAVSLLI